MATCQENCDNSCEALNGLYEKAVNLIAYSNLINSWVNGPKTGSVNIAGTNTPTLLNIATTLKTNSDNLIATLQSRINNLPSSIIASGGGIGLDSNGNLVVDFSAMPTDKFEAMLKSIRVPIWLNAHMNLYVANNGVDNSAESGRGFSAAKPFKTIQYAVNFVNDNYNLSRYNCYIHLAAGIYDISSVITLGSYSTNTGAIVIQGADLDANHKPTSFIRATNTGIFTLTKAVTYYLRNIGYIFNITSDIPSFTSLIALNNGTVTIDGFTFSIAVSNWSSSVSGKDIRGLYASGPAVINLSNGTDVNCAIAISGNTTTINTISSFLSIYGGTMNILGSGTEAYSNIACSGNISTFAMASGGSIGTNRTYGTRLLKFTGSSFTGKRYNATAGGRISVSGADNHATYFPGNVAGTADSSTFSYYS